MGPSIPVDPRRIALIRLSALGDVVMALPAAEALRAAFPEAHLTWIVDASIAPLVRAADAVDEVVALPFRRWKRDLSSITGALKPIAEGWALSSDLGRRGFDLALDFQGNLKSGCVLRATRAPLRLGFARGETREGAWLFANDRLPDKLPPMHRVDRNLILAARAGAQPARRPLRLTWLEADQRAGEGAVAGLPGLGPLVLLHPGTSAFMPHKRWGLERYAALGTRLAQEADARILVSWGPGEERDARALLDAIDAPKAMLPPMTLPELGSLLALPALVIGGDTGPLHLAAAQGTAALVLLGPSDPRLHYPEGHPERALYRRVPCSPCRYRNCPDRLCLSAIETDSVVERALAILAARESRTRTGAAGSDPPEQQ